MKHDGETRSTSMERIGERKMSLALVLRVPYARAEDVETQLENLFGELIIYRHWDSGRLFITRTPPEDRE